MDEISRNLEFLDRKMKLSIEECSNDLDRIVPGWERNVNSNKLDMGEDHLCIIGQLFGSWVEYQGSINKSMLGFSSSADRYLHMWKAEIESRLNRLEVA